MADDEKNKIIQSFLQSASQEEIEELEKLLRQKKENRFMGKINLDKIARDMATNIREQMGVSTENIKLMAKNLVITLARQHSPGITDQELEILLDDMVPGMNEKKAIPDRVLISMIEYFILYSEGEMSEKMLRQFPSGWTRKYWQAFPGSVKGLIALYLNGEIVEKEFWIKIREFFQ